MIVAHANRQQSPAQKDLRAYFNKYSLSIGFCGLFVDLDLAKAKVANSFSSTTSARFCLELALLFGVMTPLVMMMPLATSLMLLLSRMLLPTILRNHMEVSPPIRWFLWLCCG